MVLAGAGSGKTRVLTTRAAWLIEQGKANADQILLVTFTNKAAGEMKNRVNFLTGQDLPHTGTFHSLCAKILRKSGHLIDLNHSFTIYDADDQQSLINDIYKQHSINKKEVHPKGIKNTISNAKNELISPESYQETAYGNYQITAAKVYKLYERALRQAEAVDFDDLLLMSVKLLQNSPQVLAEYQGQFQQILVDEYQDTNKAQYTLTQLLAKAHSQIYVVGDFSQSIYAWRGADYRNMLTLKTDYPDMAEYRLEQNYRSTQNILDAATGVISQNSSHPILSLWTKKSAQEKVGLIEAYDQSDEASRVVAEIQSLRMEFALSQIAVLYRTNAQSRSFEEALVLAAIPYRLVGGFKFYERKEIKDVLSYLKIFHNPKDTVSTNRAQKIGKRRLQSALNLKQKLDGSDQLTNATPAEQIKLILESTQYQEKFDDKDPDDLSRLENIEELINVASQFRDLATFLENIALVQDDHFADAQQDEDPGEAVTLMSLHSAKGLEFDVIFLVGMEEGLLPHSRSMFDNDQLEEERRLCYVGITRAKNKLYLSYTKKRFQYGRESSSVPSRFLSEIPSQLLDKPLANAQSSQTKTNSTGRKLIPLDNESLDELIDGDLSIDDFLDLP